MRLIDADDLLAVPFRITGKFGGKYPFEAITVSVVNASPTIDAVPVVRCRDCKWHGANGVCEWISNESMKNLRDKDDFCSSGERRNENG